jgi:hypothetical protein
MLAARWRPVAAELRSADAAEARAVHPDDEHRKCLPAFWSPWLLIK